LHRTTDEKNLAVESITNDATTSVECKRIRRIALGDLLHTGTGVAAQRVRCGIRASAPNPGCHVTARSTDQLSVRLYSYTVIFASQPAGGMTSKRSTPDRRL
jgi:hypothetical protein